MPGDLGSFDVIRAEGVGKHRAVLHLVVGDQQVDMAILVADCFPPRDIVAAAKCGVSRVLRRLGIPVEHIDAWDFRVEIATMKFNDFVLVLVKPSKDFLGLIRDSSRFVSPCPRWRAVASENHSAPDVVGHMIYLI